MLGEDGEIIVPAGLSTNAPAIFPGEPRPSDLTPTEKTKQKAEALALYSEGLAFESKGDFDQALAVFEKVVALDPDFVELRIKIGFEYLRREETPKAEETFTRVIKDKPDNPSGYTALALVKKNGWEQ